MWLYFALALSCFMSLIGCALLAMSQSRPWRMVFDTSVPDKVAGLRIIAWACVVVSLLSCLAVDKARFMVLLWPLILSLSALVATMLIATRPGLFRPLKPGLMYLTGAD